MAFSVANNNAIQEGIRFMAIVLFGDQSPEKVEKDITAEIVLGAPRQFVELMYSGNNDTLKSGIWESSEGVFRAYYHGIVEFCHILEGGAVITTSDGQSVMVKGGDGFVLEEGLETEWVVGDYIKKHFFICNV
ncbi:cupin domain-containing protein [uncultured Ruegeria sp.]|uniref:cupin domain-containing protein n=1 Tax=uncultured Ruegeria sp. TaxID=259304 RepID=UPI00262DB7FC|nr:cupin domain-containing protein [uncultured Ruegeria sp.]